MPVFCSSQPHRPSLAPSLVLMTVRRTADGPLMVLSSVIWLNLMSSGFRHSKIHTSQQFAQPLPAAVSSLSRLDVPLARVTCLRRWSFPRVPATADPLRSPEQRRADRFGHAGSRFLHQRAFRRAEACRRNMPRRATRPSAVLRWEFTPLRDDDGRSTTPPEGCTEFVGGFAEEQTRRRIGAAWVHRSSVRTRPAVKCGASGLYEETTKRRRAPITSAAVARSLKSQLRGPA